MSSLGRAIAVAAASTLAAASAHAAQRTFVASNGNDLNACSLAAPCRSFAAAIAQTSTGGEVIVLESAGYGAVTITKSVSLIAPPGIYAGISVFSGDGIVVNGGGINVVLRGASINGQGGDAGINILDAAEVHVESCVVSNMGAHGLLMQSTFALLVKDSTLRDNFLFGIRQNSGFATYENVRSERNGRGLDQLGGVAAITRSTFQQNFDDGIRTAGRISMESSVVHGNAQNGVNILPGGSVGLTRSLIDGNGATGIVVDDAVTTLTQTSVTRSGQNSVTSPGISVSGATQSRAILLESVVNTAGASAPGIFIGANGLVFSYGNNAIAPAPNAPLSAVPLE